MALDEAGVKRSVLALRCAGVIQDAVRLGDIDPRKVDSVDNCADVFTKYMPFQAWLRHMRFILNVPQADGQ